MQSSGHEIEDGASAVEYSMLASLIAVAIIVAVGVFGSAVSGLFTDTQSRMCADTGQGLPPSGCTEPG